MASTSDKEVLGDMDGSKVMQVLTKNELERLTEVFKMYETGVREAAIRPTVIPRLSCRISESSSACLSASTCSSFSLYFQNYYLRGH